MDQSAATISDLRREIEVLKSKLGGLESLGPKVAALRREFPVKPVPYTAPNLGMWAVTTLDVKPATAAADDWDNDFAKTDGDHFNFLHPTRTAELVWTTIPKAGAWADFRPIRFATAWWNDGSPYTAKALLHSSSWGNVGIKMNSDFINYTADSNAIQLQVRNGHNRLTVQIKTQTNAGVVGRVQLEGIIYEVDQCRWALGKDGSVIRNIFYDGGDGGGLPGLGEGEIIIPP